MRTIDKFYNDLRYVLFETNNDLRLKFIDKDLSSELKYVRLIGKIMNAWIEEFQDDFYPSDYWTEKWIILKRVLVGKRKHESIDRIVDCCLLIIGTKCNRVCFSNENYETILTRWV